MEIKLMKKVLLSLVIGIVAFVGNVTGQTGGAREYLNLADTTAMKAYTGGAQYIMVTDSASGGSFYLYNGASAANGQDIFQGQGGRKWRRILSIGVPGPITNLIAPGQNVSITGLGRPGNPYVINAEGGQSTTSNSITVAGLKGAANPSLTVPYYVTDKGQEGFFYYDATETGANNGGGTNNSGTIIVNTATGRRYKRSYDGILNIYWFGGNPDGVYPNTGTDNTPALNQMASVALDNQIMYIPKAAGYWRFASTPNAWTNSKQMYLIVDGNTLHNGQTFIHIQNSARNNRFFHNGNMLGNTQTIGTHSKSAFDTKTGMYATSGYNWSSLTGYGVWIQDAHHNDIRLNFV
ncbi:MAG TPA: hypothetical protein VEC37_11035, partial [Bacillota bacterium]|nr:hypothetical protein [Bacillota bacterium]